MNEKPPTKTDAAGRGTGSYFSEHPRMKLFVALVCGLVFGAGLVGLVGTPSKRPPPSSSENVVAKGIQLWTCSMHPQVKLLKPGQCPLCSMDLIPLRDEGGYRELVLSDRAVKLAEIVYEPVQRKPLWHELRMVGKVTYNETLVTYLTAWVDGRIDDLYVDFTGIAVEKGHHLVKLYSPELISSQEELIRSLEAYQKAKKRAEESQEGMGESLQWQLDDSTRNLHAAREKLRLLGLKKEQIDTIETLKKPEDHVIIYAPVGGVVIHKNAQEGMYVKTGTRLYTIADLSHVWVELDAYESDIEWLSLYQDVRFTTEAHPGEVFKGIITFIQPVLNDKTRTVKVRVDVANQEMKLKPDMFVSATVHVKAGVDGAIKYNAFPNKWVCPMHLEVLEDEPGSCRICNMALKQTETLALIPQGSRFAEPPLVVPASAVLKTGKRAVVYVKVPDEQIKKEKKELFEGRTIILGPKVKDLHDGRVYYIVRSGLAVGELVVYEGSFKLDSSLQIKAKRSMMSKGGGSELQGHAGHTHAGEAKTMQANEGAGQKIAFPQSFRTRLAPLYRVYFKVQQALGEGKLEEAKSGFREIRNVATAIDASLLEADNAYKEAGARWRDYRRAVENAGLLGSDKTINSLKEAQGEFLELTEAVLEIQQLFGHTGEQTHYIYTCSMALNTKGARWLQANAHTTLNPYYGPGDMQTCGQKGMSFTPQKAAEPTLAIPALFRSQLSAVYDIYFQIQMALASDDSTAASQAATAMGESLNAVEMKRLTDSVSQALWMARLNDLNSGLKAVSEGADLTAKRQGFKAVSAAMVKTVQIFGHTDEKPIYILSCTMALDNEGATWLQTDKNALNPYFGIGEMLSCRTGIDELPPVSDGGEGADE